MSHTEDDEYALCQGCTVQTRESALDSDGFCADCRKEEAHVVIWIAGTTVTGGGVFNSPSPEWSPINGGTPVCVQSIRRANARTLAKSWYRLHLPSIERAYPVITLWALLIALSGCAETSTTFDARHSTDDATSRVTPDAAVQALDAHTTRADAHPHDAASPLDTWAEPLDATTCAGRCSYMGGAYYWSPSEAIGDGCFSPSSFRCGGGCDPMVGCIDAGH